MSDNHTWRIQQNRARSEQLYSIPNDPNQGTKNVAIWELNNLDPFFSCPHIHRVGGRGDGPKWVCDPHCLAKKKDCLIYSIGSNGNYKFEDGIVSLLKEHTGSETSMSNKWKSNCEIHTFDPATNYGREFDPQVNNIHYHPWGLKSSKEDARPGFYSIQEIRKLLKHENRVIDIFKIDCESCEWSTYEDWLHPDVDIRQVLVETHGLLPEVSKFFDRFFDAGFVLFSKEANIHPDAKAWCME
jgi:Methyltransferase domain